MIDLLCGDKIDYELELYWKLKDLFEKGITFDESIIPYLNHTLIGKEWFAEDLFFSNCLIVDENSSLTNLFPHGLGFLLTKDILASKWVGRNVKVTLKSSMPRIVKERYNPAILGTRLKELKDRLIGTLEFLPQDYSIHINTAKFLVKLNILKSSNFELRVNKAAKGYILDRSALIDSIKEFISIYKENNIWPVEFNSIQEYLKFYNPDGRWTIDVVKKTAATHEVQMNKIISNWSQPVVSYKNIFDDYMNF